MAMGRHEQPGGTLYSTGSNVDISYTSDFSLDHSPQYQIGQRQTQSESGLEQSFNFTTDTLKPNNWGQSNVQTFLASPETPWDGLQHDMHSNMHYQMHHRAYLPSPRSECSSIPSAPLPSDSGYVSNLMGNTVHSGNGSESLDATRTLAEKPGKKVINQIVKTRVAKKPMRSRSISQPNGTQRKWQCQRTEECREKSITCQSAYDKHMRMHEKPFRCNYLGCTYHNGFTTQNDLDRHLKSKHLGGIDSKSKSWQCVGKGCKSPAKIWPRFDNFKQHVTKMHSKENARELIERSQIGPKMLPDDHAASGSEGEAINPLDLNKQGSTPTQTITPELKVTTSDANIATQSPDLPIDFSRLSPQGRGRHRHRSPAPRLALASPSLSVNGVSTGLESLIAATELRAANDSPIDTPNSVAIGPGVMTPVQLEALKLILGVMNSSSTGNNQNTSNSTATSGVQQSVANLDTSSHLLKELLKIQALQPIMSQANPLTGSLTNSVDEEGEEGDFPCTNPGCKRRLKRQCELNKHLKRHTKPYGCTFSHCHKRFGSKNDWKRHENSQHFQIELWKCQEPVAGNPAGICGNPYYTEESMISHLINQHSLFKSNATARAFVNYVGRNNQTRFWCGFCGKVLSLKTGSGLAAWEERFTHIDEHFKKGEMVDDWIDDSTHKPKGESTKETDKKKKTDNQSNTSMHATAQPSSTMIAPLSANSNKRARSVSGDRSLPALQRRRVSSSHQAFPMWGCCSCGDIGGMIENCENCVYCNHIKCGNCDVD